MKIIFISLLVLLVSGTSYADTVLKNCYSSTSSVYFVHSLEAMAQEKETPVLLLNEAKEVVGVMSVSPNRDEKYPHKAASVVVNKVELCASLQVSDFYYADDDLLDWASMDSISITQDEGLLQLKVSVVEKNKYATLMKATFNAYDVFSEEDEVAAGAGQPGFIEDWGLPKGSGEFYFYMPSQWSK
ncbi:MAG: hypothetical protein KDD37_03225 [Bdellovibrionales bacterium]|nr:hypothetical protein [Bdellovibrionales bacterium]